MSGAALPETRRIERPPLASLPLPPRWHLNHEAGVLEHASGEYQMEADELDGDGELDAGIFLARDVVALLEWLKHERAVAAQRSPKRFMLSWAKRFMLSWVFEGTKHETGFATREERDDAVSEINYYGQAHDLCTWEAP